METFLASLFLHIDLKNINFFIFKGPIIDYKLYRYFVHYETNGKGVIQNDDTRKTSLRVTGLASGMNTDEIVSNLVKVQSARLNKMQQNKTLASTWKSDAYRDVNKKVDEFRKVDGRIAVANNL